MTSKLRSQKRRFFEVRNLDMRTLSWWNDREAEIDMDPPYQRHGNLWSLADQQYLIDSILNGFDIPKIYLADFTLGESELNTKGKQYAVIDGKQRLSAIFSFAKDKFGLAQNFEWPPNPTLRLSGLNFSELKERYPKVAERFVNFNLSAMGVYTNDEAKINELFVRLNKGKPLTGAELRNAMNGIVPELIRSIASHEFFQSRTRFKTTRRQADNVGAKLLLVEFRGRLVETKKTSLNRFVDEGVHATAQVIDFERAAQRVKDTLEKMFQAFQPQDPLLGSQGPVTIYYWFFRELGDSDLGKARRFLEDFGRRRLENRKVVAGNLIDSVLVRYDLLDRSTNDQSSLEGRYEILAMLYREFDK